MLRKFVVTVLTIQVGLLSFTASAKLPYYPLQFPRDDAAHYANVPYATKTLTEWWYYNGKITTKEGRHFGYFVAAFRINTPLIVKGELTEAMLMTQLTDIDKQKVYGARSQFKMKDTSFSTTELAIKMGAGFALHKVDNQFVLTDTVKTSQNDNITLTLTLTPSKNPLLVGGNGLIDMWSDTNSYYYSNTRMTTTGTVQLNSEMLQVNPQTSSSWMDHQWGDFLPDHTKAQWIWSSIELDNGVDLSAFELIDPLTKQPIRELANIIMPDDTRLYTNVVVLQTGAKENDGMPTFYEVGIPADYLLLGLTALAPGQDTNGFWEGIHSVSGITNNKPITGFGFVENTVDYN